MSGYFIYARVCEGKPSLEIVDAESQQTCLEWAGHNSKDVISDRDLQELFRRLLLLTCRQKLKARLMSNKACGAQN